jgi:hypothetical protein
MEWESYSLREVVAHHTSKAPRPPEAGRTDGVADEADGTLDWFLGHLISLSSGKYHVISFELHIRFGEYM